MNKNLIVILSMLTFVGCGSSSSDKKKNDIDIANYLPNKSMSKSYTHVTKIDGNVKNNSYTDTVIVESNLLSIKEDAKLKKLISIKVDEVEIKYLNDVNLTKKLKRHIVKGDTVSKYLKKDEREILKIGSQKIGEKYTKVEEECTLDEMINHYEKFFFVYTNYDDNHNIMKIKCTTKSVIETKVDEQYKDLVSYKNGIVESKPDISYVYLQRDLGMVATINDDCLVSKLPDIIDDTVAPEECLGERYEDDLYQPQY